jgi:hypothetical protein
MQGGLTTCDDYSLQLMLSRAKEAHDLILRNGCRVLHGIYELRVVAVRASEVAAPGEDNRGDLSREISQGKFLKAADYQLSASAEMQAQASLKVFRSLNSSTFPSFH